MSRENSGRLGKHGPRVGSARVRNRGMAVNGPSSAEDRGSRWRGVAVCVARSLAAITLSQFLPFSTLAGIRYWDGGSSNIGTDGDGASGGTAGTWDTTLTNWDQGSAAAHVAWLNANNDTAVFGGVAGAVTLGSNIDVGGLTFNTTGYGITATGFSLNFAATSKVLFNNVAAATITGTVGGAGNVILSSSNVATAGTLTLNGSSSGGWSGTTTISPGMTLALAADNRALANTIGITLNGGAITLTNAAGQSALDRVSNSAGIASNGGTITWTNPNGDNTANWAETLGTLGLTSGQTNIVSTNAVNAARTQVLTLGAGSLTYAAGNTSAITFSGASLGTGTVNNILITSEAATAASQIIGPWATYGTAANAQTDYAVYNITAGVANSRGIQGAGIAPSAESTWSAAHAPASNYTLANSSGSAANGRLTATRNINSLRNTTAVGGAVSVNTTSDYVTLAGNSFADGDVVVMSTTAGGLVAGVPYYVRDAGGGGAGTFKLAPNSGGTAIDITATTTSTITGGITLPSGFNLGTYGILNGSTAILAIGGNGGAVTLPTTSAGNLYVNAGAGAVALYAPVNDNTGALTLVKNGSANLVLGSTASNFSGGIVLNAGTLGTTADANLGSGGGVTFDGSATWSLGAVTNATYNRAVTINDGATATFTSGSSNPKIISGPLTGSGGLIWSTTTDIYFSNTNNTFNGPITVTTGGTNPYGLSVASLGDAAGAGVVNLGGAASTGYFYWYGAAQTFDDRQFALAGTTGGGVIDNRGSGALVISRDLLVTGAGNKSLTFAGTNTGTNTFSGNVADGTGSVIGVSKAGVGRWDLSGNLSNSGGVTNSGGGTLNLRGTNTYSGATTMGFNNPAGPGITFQGIQALSPNTSLVQSHVGGSGGHGPFRILDDSATPASRSGVNLTFNQSNASQNVMSLFVGNNSAANGGTSSSTQQNSVIQLGNMNFNQTVVGAGAGASLSISGANGYKLQLANINVNLQAAYAAAWPVRLTANAPLIVGGNVQQAAGSGGTTTLQLDGTASGSLISGNVLNSLDGTPKVLSLAKSGTGSWTLSGSNTYTGGTTISGGALQFEKVNAMPDTGTVAVQTGATIAVNVGGAGEFTNATSGNGSIGGLLGGTGGQGAAVSYAGAVKLGIDTSNAGASVTYGGNIANVGTSLGITKLGTCTLLLSGTNTNTGVTAVNAGTLQFARQASLYNSATASWTAANLNVVSGGTLAFNVGGTDEFTPGNVTMLLTNLAASSSATNGMNAGANLGFDTTNASGGTFTIGNVLANTTGTSGGARGLTKLGSGSLVLTNSNTYTGGTSVMAGTLLVNNSADSGTGTGAVNVALGATLGGNGAIAGAVTLAGGALLSPGNSPGSLETGSLTLANTSVLNWELAAPNQGITAASDRVDVAGDLTLNGLLNVAALAGFGTPADGDSWVLFTYSGTLSNETLDLLTLPPLSSGLEYEVDTATAGQVRLAVTVPEPSAIGLLTLAGCGLLAHRRRSIGSNA